jgi:hypothetical protein
VGPGGQCRADVTPGVQSRQPAIGIIDTRVGARHPLSLLHVIEWWLIAGPVAVMTLGTYDEVTTRHNHSDDCLRHSRYVKAGCAMQRDARMIHSGPLFVYK